jgi:hypothetical protein
MGKVGTGWSRTVSSQIRKQLDTVVSPKSKLTRPIRKPKATWVEPTFVADVEYRDITSEGLLRASSFNGGILKHLLSVTGQLFGKQYGHFDPAPGFTHHLTKRSRRAVRDVRI